MSIPSSFPAIRSHIGDWAYFITVLPFAEVAERIRRADEIHTNKGLHDMIQRALSDRKMTIADYIRTQGERFFNAIVVGIYGGSPDWFPVDIEANSLRTRGDLQPVNLTTRAREAFGVLQLSGQENLFAIDGQHRVEGIKEALEVDPDLAREELAVLFVAHRTTAEGRARTRRLFTTLNKYAVPVRLHEIIALDEDDAFAIVTRLVVERYEGLAKTIGERDELIGLVRYRQALTPPSDHHSITSIETIYKLIEVLAFPRSDSKTRSAYKRSRPSPDVIESMYEEHVSFWEALRKHVMPMFEALGSRPEDCIAGRYRTREGGHILFRPVGQIAFGRAVRVLQDRNVGLDEAVGALSQTVLALNEVPWANVLWDPGRHAMLRSKPELSESLFLHMVNEPPRRQNYDLDQVYRDAVGDEELSIYDIPREMDLR